MSLKCLTKDFIIFLQAEKYGYFRLFVAILGQKKSRNNLNSAVSALTGRGIRTCTLCRTLAFAGFACSANRILRILTSSQKKKTGTWWYLFSSWQRYKDSNLKWRSQSPECYRYTIPLYYSKQKPQVEIAYCWIILTY